MNVTDLVEIIIAVALVIGALFTLVGSIGLLKLDTAMKRLHAPTKAATLGIGSLLVASMLHSFAFGSGSLKEILIMVFLFVTAPISANFIAKVAIHRGQDMPPPEPPKDQNWATLNPTDETVPGIEAPAKT
ncbi:Na+/H+ antiporter subunit G [Puniceibacterium sediminis]|uniref:Multisubunit potassium/proton antiporter, PhaG subunit n=1 Tax=Puniceibacterium sediminis TaxID=1608407 RepID=A0A238WVL7_9RHOB|nr:Na+/H+ antiporter subunit G [Puniceibacterium sediminis]SNR50421.1 multisubunit potassium/proton antiporter, PhaG subunit [Puniceibacterium sediminis]